LKKRSESPLSSSLEIDLKCKCGYKGKVPAEITRYLIKAKCPACNQEYSLLTQHEEEHYDPEREEETDYEDEETGQYRRTKFIPEEPQW